MTVVAVLCVSLVCANVSLAAIGSAGTGARSEPAEPAAPERSGTSLAEKIACAYLFVGGAIMLYYGPTERENGQVTRDGKSEAVAGAAAIGISIGLLRDIIKKSSRRKRPN